MGEWGVECGAIEVVIEGALGLKQQHKRHAAITDHHQSPTPTTFPPHTHTHIPSHITPSHTTSLTW